jgi:hypothetical protein
VDWLESYLEWADSFEMPYETRMGVNVYELYVSPDVYESLLNAMMMEHGYRRALDVHDNGECIYLEKHGRAVEIWPMEDAS